MAVAAPGGRGRSRKFLQLKADEGVRRGLSIEDEGGSERRSLMEGNGGDGGWKLSVMDGGLAAGLG
jgi:hypothetical protein